MLCMKKDSSTEKESNVCSTLSSWVQSKPENEGCIDQSRVAISEGILDFGKTPGDRPILGTVAAHWNTDQTPKLWGGNGIPNTTTKYKEDQKVSWHATPFEQRLEKALSEDQCILKRHRVKPKLGLIQVELPTVTFSFGYFIAEGQSV
ncbi:hypothetical protein CTI12_AA542330 [Artemisia annua]|uniref:Protein JASON n=1 Tax=Artemisia annua TaxID=35608 RepID=A0A2U1L117_ARTAN|nr:hypothetical protein CTI12_AA542330 [Artemisia annua]